ncbi:cellulase family glycosylhydrolase [Phytohabitans sp. LJ34]|uniref:cellulase family glycosylhydrolase n=1 Tax=Phytohabitans sp. LJ34 TaxID=3452217 RepID=UPI003F8B3287
MAVTRRIFTFSVVVLLGVTAGAAAPAAAPLPTTQGVYGAVFRDDRGREIVLRGFNVAGSAKLTENGLLPFRSRADAATSAQAMRDLTGANAIRFLISWEGVQPARHTIDYGYLDRAIEQIREFTDRGIHVLVDYHQDLYSAHLFDDDSWYDGDGAPKWVIDAGDYPDEFCGICFLWGQNMQNNAAVREAMYDFWRNEYGVQDAFLDQAGATMRYLRQRLPAAAFDRIVGFDPFNEPFDGGLDGGTGAEWERRWLLPFYQRFRARMDEAGWAAKPAYVEPLVFWNTGFFEQGGLSTIAPLGTRYVFNSHYYDGARITLDPTPAGDGTYAAAMNRVRDRARTLATAPFVSEFGNSLHSDRTPWMVRAMYQGMDAGVPGASWWGAPASGGTVLSNTMWHWDIYSGRHAEPGDGWNGEDHSVVAVDAAGTVVPRLDRRVLDRLFPTAVAGSTLAFAYEDLARSGYGGAGQQQAWLAAPQSLPAIRALTAGRQYGVLVWRGTAGTTELHLPASFAPATTTVVTDVTAVTTALEEGSATARRLLLDAGAGVHAALVVNTTGGTVTAAQLAAAQRELATWRTRHFPS